MKKSRFILIVMMIVPWFTLPMLGSKAVKRYLPATIFISVFSELLHILANKLHWWRIYSSIHPKIRPSIAFTLGPEFIATLWFLKVGFGRFRLFLLINSIAHFLFAYPAMHFFRKFRIGSLEKFSSFQFVLVLSVRGIILYGFQLVKEKFFPKKRLW